MIRFFKNLLESLGVSDFFALNESYVATGVLADGLWYAVRYSEVSARVGIDSATVGISIAQSI